MLCAVWSTKGGVGVSSVAAMLALAQSARAVDTLLVDLVGDLPAVLGVADTDTPGVADWCATPRHPVDALARIQQSVAPDLKLLHRGHGALEQPTPLIDALIASQRPVVADCGTAEAGSFAAEVASRAQVRLLVVRACYLCLRTVQNSSISPSGVVLVRDHRRALGLGDVERVVTAPVVAEIALDPGIARTIDAGLVANRLPRTLLRSMGRVLADAA